jgi:poly-beta-1,6-N-acetyl-D-glucosamine synthase
MKPKDYVLITPVKDEASTIETTIQSVINQTILPVEWIIVSDNSTDKTEEIINRYEKSHKFMRLIRLSGGASRSFSSVVTAMETGMNEVTKECEYVGLIDADLRFPANYFEILIERFMANPKLGLCGGLVQDVVDGKIRRSRQYLADVAGATQFFRKECFKAIKNLIAIPEGGWDAITCVQARANGFETQTFSDLIVEHLKPRNAFVGNPLQRKWLMGTRDYALGNHPFFETLKCLARSLESPIVIGMVYRLAGFYYCYMIRKTRIIPKEIMEQIRKEQMRRILGIDLSRSIKLHKYQG